MLTVVKSVANSPAMKAGILAGDQIIKINEKKTDLLSLEDASEEIRGEIGTDVNIGVSSAKDRNLWC